MIKFADEFTFLRPLLQSGFSFAHKKNRHAAVDRVPIVVAGSVIRGGYYVSYPIVDCMGVPAARAVR